MSERIQRLAYAGTRKVVKGGYLFTKSPKENTMSCHMLLYRFVVLILRIYTTVKTPGTSPNVEVEKVHALVSLQSSSDVQYSGDGAEMHESNSLFFK